MGNTNPRPEQSQAGSEAAKGAVVALTGPIALGAVVSNVAALPEAFEHNPQGGHIVAGLLICLMICWVLVTWLKHRRS